MAEYIQLPIEVDPLELEEQGVAYLQELVPGWIPAEGNLDWWLLQVAARMAADLRSFASDVPDTIFRYFGEEVIQVLPLSATYASFQATVTADDDSGYVMPAGTQVGVRKPDGTSVGFALVSDVTIANGDTVSGTGEAVFSAIEPGEEGSGLTTAADDISLVDSLPWVESIVGTGITTGGEDGEDEDEYQDRLVDELRLMTPRPVLPADFATVARRVNGVERAYWINLYNGDTNTADVEKAITIVPTDEDGEAVSGGIKTEVADLIESLREVNFLVFVKDPQYQEVAIEYEVTALPDYDTATVETAVDAAIAEYISPKRWGEVQFGTEAVDYWRPVNVVRYLEVATVINNVSGVDFIDLLELDGGTADVTLDPGVGIPVVLPRATPVTGTVNPAP